LPAGSGGIVLGSSLDIECWFHAVGRCGRHLPDAPPAWQCPGRPDHSA
jgi:hypothetical protein